MGTLSEFIEADQRKEEIVAFLATAHPQDEIEGIWIDPDTFHWTYAHGMIQFLDMTRFGFKLVALTQAIVELRKSSKCPHDWARDFLNKWLAVNC